MSKAVIVALDFPSKAQTLEFLDKFRDDKPFVKIGMELFYAEGPQIIRAIKERGHPIFLDLKLHDIPNTVEKAMRSLSGLDVDMVNLHAAGGKAMMEAAVRGLTRPDGTRPLLIAVTQLTSISDDIMHKELLIEKPLETVVTHYARNAKEAGLDGIVCSPWESPAIHDALGDSFLTVTPGIRFEDGDAGDQKRIATPARAKALTSNCIVVGRPITGAQNPEEAYRRCVHEFCL